MQHLINLEFHYNLFTGTVPDEWYSGIPNLQRLNIAGNALSGSIPSTIGRLSLLKGFFAFENSLTGTIPTEVGQLESLSEFGSN